jgi:O-antigen/teichoic acid export membrane protein
MTGPDVEPPARESPAGPGSSHDQTMRTLGRGVVTLVISTVLFVLFGFFARVTIARVVSISQWGEFSLGLALSQFLGIVIALGLPSAVSRALSYEPDVVARRHLVRTTLLAAVVSAIAGSAVVYALAGVLARGFHDPGLTIVFQLFAPAIGFTVLSAVFAAYFQGVERVGANAWFNQALNPALFLAFLAVALFAHTGFFGILVAYCASAAAACAALAVYTWRTLPTALAHNPSTLESDPSGHVSLLKMTITLFGAGSLNLLTQFADTLILGVFWSTAVVGLYAAGMTLARLFLAGASALVYIYLPVSARLRRTRDYEALRRTYVTSARWVTVITLPVFFVFFFDPGATLGFVFGANYAGGVLALRILSLASFASVIIGPANSGLSGLGHPGANMAAAGTSLIVNVGLSFALIPTWGLIGAAIAWSVARIVYTFLCLGYVWRLYAVTPFTGRFARPLLLSFVVLTPIFLLVPVPGGSVVMLLGLAAIALAVAVLAIPLTRSVETGDLALFDSLERATGLRLAGIRRYLESHLAAEPVGMPT